MNLEIGLVDLPRVVDAALDSLRPAAQAKAIRLDVVTEPRVGLIPGDAARLQQVIWNLLSNAIKFTQKGGRVEVRVQSAESKSEIRVSDNGRGIEAEFLPHLFERFRQADSSSTRSEGGLGLGLAIVRHLVELHGGTVDAESAGLGHGSTFIVQLRIPAVGPVTDVGSATVPMLGNDLPAISLQSLTGVRILIVDDERDAREAVAAVLEAYGAQVTATANAGDALAALEQAVPEVIITDLAMPTQDGYSFLRAVRGRPTDTSARIPAIALSAYGGVPNSDAPSQQVATHF